MGLSTLSTPYSSDMLKNVIPRIGKESKSELSLLIRSNERRESYYYSSAVGLPFTKNLSKYLSRQDILREMYYRLVTNDSIDESIPLFTKLG